MRKTCYSFTAFQDVGIAARRECFYLAFDMRYVYLRNAAGATPEVDARTIGDVYEGKAFGRMAIGQVFAAHHFQSQHANFLLLVVTGYPAKRN